MDKKKIDKKKIIGFLNELIKVANNEASNAFIKGKALMEAYHDGRRISLMAILEGVESGLFDEVVDIV